MDTFSGKEYLYHVLPQLCFGSNDIVNIKATTCYCIVVAHLTK